MDLGDAESLRAELRTLFGVRSRTTAPTVKVLSAVEEDGFKRQLVHLDTSGDTIPAFVAIPPGTGPFPGIVVFHQHAGQRHLGKSEVYGLAGDRFQAFGPALARAGLVVLAPDSVAFEDRRPGGPGTDPRDDDWEQHYNALTHRLVAGETLMAKVLDDAMVAVSALAEQPDVDAGAVGALGHSYGGNTTLFLMAVDERVRFGCASGALGSYRRKMADGTGIEMAEVIPGFAARFDMDHVLAAIAPRPLLAVSGTDDKCAADADELVALAERAYRAAGAAGGVSHIRVPGGHALDATGSTPSSNGSLTPQTGPHRASAADARLSTTTQPREVISVGCRVGIGTVVHWLTRDRTPTMIKGPRREDGAADHGVSA